LKVILLILDQFRAREFTKDQFHPCFGFIQRCVITLGCYGMAFPHSHRGDAVRPA
jgi:hypothetical protein